MTASFHPIPDSTVNINVSSTSQSVFVTSTNDDIQVRVANDGTATAWVKFGNAPATASTTLNMPVMAGSVEVFTVSVDGGALYMAAIAAGSTGKIYATPGFGY